MYAGVDALANRHANRSRLLRGSASYYAGGLRAVTAWRPARYRVTVDGEEHPHTGYTVVAANSGHYGSGRVIAPDARVDDGLLDVVMIRHAPRRLFFALMNELRAGTHVRRPQVRILRGGEIRIEADRDLPYGADGEVDAVLPVTVRVLPEPCASCTDRRSEPGAAVAPGRPAGLHRRSAAQTAVSLPDRRREPAGRLLARGRGGMPPPAGEPVREAPHRGAHEAGVRLRTDGGGQEVVRVRERYGFEPRTRTRPSSRATAPSTRRPAQHADRARHEPAPGARSPRKVRRDGVRALPGTGTGPAPRPPGAHRPPRPPGGAP
ncbi:hypothetical protein GCM10023238_39510 [Streptomyces heliomycini]